MDRLKKLRRSIRSSVTRRVAEAETGLIATPRNMISLQAQFEKLEDLWDQITELDSKIMDALIEANCTDEEQDEERINAEEYEDKIRLTKIKLNSVLQAREKSPTPPPSEFGSGVSDQLKKRNFKLPKIELKKFNGDLKEWLGFWSQFKKIHEDESLHESDKFQYLVQAMESGTEPKDLVCSYPQSAENYPKAVEALQERFGRENLLLQVYVRELLKLVINNVTQREKVSLARMYINLESHLRALSSLNLATADPSTWLFPLLESSLPLDTLRAWQRSPLSKKDGKDEDPQKSSLDFLMEFIKNEVQSEQQIELAQSGFQDKRKSQVNEKSKPKCTEMSKSGRFNVKSEDIPTVAGLHVGNQSCLFCENSHPAKDCGKARKMKMSEKTELIKKKGCCLICFRRNHMAKDCKSNFIKCLICGKKHYEIMCPEAPIHKNMKNQETGPMPSTSDSNVVANCAASSTTYLGTFMTTLVNGDKKMEVRALYDPGAQRSYLTSAVAEELGLSPIAEEKLSHSLFGGVQTAVQALKKFRINILNVYGRRMTQMVVLEKEKICGTIPRVSTGPWLKELKKKKIWVSDMSDEDEEIKLLIGADMYGKLLTGRTYQLENGMTAIQTLLGWVVMGSLSSQSKIGESSAMTVINLFVKEASPTELWSLEILGIRDPSDHKTKLEQELMVKRQFLETVTRLPDGRYSVSLPWIDEARNIPENKKTCESRLASATSKLKVAGKYETYQNIFQSWEQEGIIEVVKDNHNKTVGHYLPHHPVFKPDSTTTPVRPVSDASCQTGRNPSLNDCLHKGPNFLEVIPSILLRFRERKIGVVADIRKAYQMIDMNEKDRNFQRFLWWELDSSKIKTYRHCRVVFGINCSPFLLRAVLELHLDGVKDKDSPIAKKLLKSFYVDNCVVSLDTIEEYDEFKRTSTRILAEAKMELRQWEFSSQISDIVENPQDYQENVMVLGYKWNKKRDTIHCKQLSEIRRTEKITKRTILSEMHKIFDPMGFLCPAMITPKILFQRAWKETEQNKTLEPYSQNQGPSQPKKNGKDQSWNQELPLATQEEFTCWRNEASVLCEIEIPRWVERTFAQEQIHTFCDASQHAYAAVVFLRVEKEDSISVQLLQAKARVAPFTKNKRTSIPRLELLSCVIAARLTQSVKEAMDLSDTPTAYWSDSTTALAWIRRNNDWGTFVGNRVKEICQTTSSEDWRHVPGVWNPADLPSRGCRPSQLLASKWWEGPDWLKLKPDYWPRSSDDVDEEEVAVELKGTIATMVSTSRDWIWNVLRYSRYTKNLKIIAMILRWRHKTQRGLSSFTVEELNRAEHRILQVVQREVFPDKATVIEGLHVIKKDGLHRVKTKVLNRQDTEDFKYPILMPNHHPWVDILIWDEHYKNKHAPTQIMMGILREKYWIVKTRRTIRDVLSHCLICKRFTVKSTNVVPASLPEERMKAGKVFETIGTDLAGPFYLKHREKAYVTLFTCAVYRCLHLEVVTALSTDAFLDAFSRFCSRRGRPHTVYCDNGTNFIGANSGFKSLDWSKIELYGNEKRIQFKFNPPSAPWWGGWWERLVRTIKDLMRRTLGRSTLSMDKFITLICEIEAVVNRRPLTTMTEDQEDFTPLTPATFLTEMEFPTGDEFLDASGFQNLSNERKELLKQFKMRFRKEYLALLVHRGKEQKTMILNVGDVVLIGSDNKRRWEWPMARIIELIPGKDGHVRVAKVKTSDGILLRAMQKLYPLEVSSSRDRPGNIEEVESKRVKENVSEVETFEKILPPMPEKVKKVTSSGRVVKIPKRFVP